MTLTFHIVMLHIYIYKKCVRVLILVYRKQKVLTIICNARVNPVTGSTTLGS